MSGVETHKDLEIWQRGIALVEEIYEVTKSFPKEELYGLTYQIRRSAVFYPSNIAEGAGRSSQVPSPLNNWSIEVSPIDCMR